jgi:hypothetical protein
MAGVITKAKSEALLMLSSRRSLGEDSAWDYETPFLNPRFGMKVLCVNAAAKGSGIEGLRSPHIYAPVCRLPLQRRLVRVYARLMAWRQNPADKHAPESTAYTTSVISVA